MSSKKDACKSDLNSEPTFSDIKKILDWLAKGKTAHLKDIHNSDSFKWNTVEELLDARVVRPEKTYRLIQPELIGEPGRGCETNLYRVLTENGLDDLSLIHI